MSISYVSPTRFEQIRAIIADCCSDDDKAKEACQRMAEVLNYDPEKYRLGLEARRQANTRCRQRAKESGRSTYTDSHKQYYDRNKDTLNAKRVENARMKRNASSGADS
jgi:hypothetical protein